MSAASLDTTRFDGALRLHDWGLIRAAGADAAGFLHGQLTQDVTHQGRLLASFVTWRRGADEILLACSADLLPATLKRLSMFVLRAKCRLSDASSEIALYGLAGASATRWLGPDAPAAPWQRREIAGGDAIRLPDGDGIARYLWAAPATGPAPALAALDGEAWRWLEVASGVVRITAATTEQFVPQMVNLELVGGVNFQKGCYPGQEVVARSQYRGTVKRRTQRVTASAALVAGQEVFHGADTGQPAGMVALAASLDDRQHAALVELKLAALDGADLHAGPARLAVGTLPYAIPADTA